jgi:type IV pilus assembly protein PilO
MNFDLTKKQVFFLLLASVILMIGFVIFYFVGIRPLEAKKGQAEETLKIEKNLFDATKEKAADDSPTVQTSYELQQKVPVEPLFDQLFSLLEEARMVANTIIEQYEMVEQGSELNNDNEEQFSINFNSDQKNIDEGQKDQTTKTNRAKLEKVTMRVTVHADTYDEMTTFIQTLEQNERIITIDQLSLLDLENKEDKGYFSFQLTFSAYYADGLQALKNEAPQMDIPEPSEKNNPLVR